MITGHRIYIIRVLAVNLTAPFMLSRLLADPLKANFVTGQNFVVDGGMTKKMIYPE